MASVTNCNSTSRLFAPIALRMPISRVLSVTETSMMFITPMPPTRSEIPAMVPRNSTNTAMIWLRDSISS